MNRVVTFGEIMGRFAAPGFKRFQQAMPGSLNVSFAGAEASIASSIAFLGAQASFVTALPNNPLGDACVASLRALGVDTSQIVRTDHGRLGLYFLETGANQRSGNVIYDREGSSVSVTPPDLYDWDAIFAGASWFVISGITPAISRNASEVSVVAVREASKRGVLVALDMNYRSKLWAWDPAVPPRELAIRTVQELMPFVDLFIGGREDAAPLVGSSGSESQEELAELLASKFSKVRYVAMSLREGLSASHNNFGGLFYEVETKQTFYAPEKGRLYAVTHIVDRIGTGDAFTAGLIFALITPELSKPETAIGFAAAAGCLAHSIEGDFNCCTRSEIEALMHGNSSGRVNR